MYFATVSALLALLPMDVDLHPFAGPGDIVTDTVSVQGADYQLLEIPGFQGWGDGLWMPGEPMLPAVSYTFLLPPDTRVESIGITDETWVPLDGRFVLLPRQRGLTDDTLFIPPDPDIYEEDAPFPEKPVAVSRQGSAMGYSVATLTASPVRYYPREGRIEVLESAEISMNLVPADQERLSPVRETVWSRDMRRRGILALVCNPQDTVLYSPAGTASFFSHEGPLQVTMEPSVQGDGVDMLIITSSELEEAFGQVASYRTRQGIVTVVRTVEWIVQHYPGCDVPESMRNFIRDAHAYWGVQAVLLGGDDGVVPVRQCNGWAYITYPFPTYQIPSDDYFGDIDGDWITGDGLWSTGYQNGYLDLCVGRWPVDDADDVETIFSKLVQYEMPEDPPAGFGRSLLMMGSNDICGTAADDMMELRAQMDSSGAIPLYLDEPTELYYPHSLPAGDLCRANALEAFDQGYNVMLHADHSETHKLATAGKNSLGQYMWDSDFATMSNSGRPSVLWTLGCGPGHFDGADCFVEAGLITSPETGLAGVIANARYGLFNQKVTYYVFADALYNTGYTSQQHGVESPHWPVSYLGEAHRISKNIDGISFVLLNLLGSPLMQIWRGTPEELELSLPPMVMVEGVPSDIAVVVTAGSEPVPGATVCLWKEDEVFRLGSTDLMGRVVFGDITVHDSSQGALCVTASKARSVSGLGSSTVACYVPASDSIDVLPASVPVLSLSGYSVEDGGDGQANPGETVDIFPEVLNSGGQDAPGVNAFVRVVSGGQFLRSFQDSECAFPDTPADSSAAALDPFTVEIEPGAPEYATIEFELTFTWMEGGGPGRWRSPLELTVSTAEYQLVCMDPVADNSGADAVVEIEDMVLVNSGTGEGIDLRLTVDNLVPPEPFQADTVHISRLASGTALDLQEGIQLTVTPQDPGSQWMQPGFPRCSFDMVVISQAGSSVARNVDAELVCEMQSGMTEPPAEPGVYETGQSTVSLVWDQQGMPDSEEYYLYVMNGMVPARIFPLPVPVRQATIGNLEPGSSYTFLITSIDLIGRESEPVTVEANTTRSAVAGWPLQLMGSAGGGPAIADVDRDGDPEIVMATSFGRVYLIERDGSYQVLEPPSGYEYDRFLGCAVGNVDAFPGNEIVVTCQKYIEVEGQERVGVLLFSRDKGIWTAREIAQSNVNQQAVSPAVAGTPVLFQADTGSSLEIGLRTRGHFGADPQLYVWRLSGQGQWVELGPEFPVNLFSYFYNSPTAVDFDGDGLQELIVTCIGTGGAGTSLTIADFTPEGTTAILNRNLSELDTGGEQARVFGTLAAAEQDGKMYVAGVASTIEPCGTIKKVFAYVMGEEPGQMSLAWSTDWLPGSDFYGNLPGPALGDPDGDTDLDVLFLLNGGVFLKEGFLYAWDLETGELTFASDTIPFNPIIEEGGHYVRSQPVVGSVYTSGPGGMPVFSCYSTMFCGHMPSQGQGMISGFPAWSRDAGWSAPAICDLNGDGVPEILHVDYSGFATLYELDDFLYGEEGWHMYQDNAHRTGFFNTIPFQSGLELRLGQVGLRGESDISESDSRFLMAEVEISGSGTAASGAEERASGEVRIIVLLPDGRRCGSASLDLVDGLFIAAIPLDDGIPASLPLAVVLDPEDIHHEINESDNRAAVLPGTIEQGEQLCRVPSPAGSVRVFLDLPAALHEGIDISVYSMDGRLMDRLDTGDLEAGSFVFDMCTDPVPSGIYGVVVRGLPSGNLIRRVVVLGR